MRFFTTLRELTGRKEEILRFPEDETVTVHSVLERLGKMHGKSFVDYVYDRGTGEVRGFLQFLVNGRNVSSLEELNVKLCDGDVLAIIPPVGGG